MSNDIVNPANIFKDGNTVYFSFLDQDTYLYYFAALDLGTIYGSLKFLKVLDTSN